MLFIQNGRLVPTLLTLARKYGVESPDDISPKDLNDKLQQKWFKEGYLRFQITGDPPGPENLETLRLLGCLEKVSPKPTQYEDRVGHPIDPALYETPLFWYEGILILGALRPRVTSRLGYFLEFRRWCGENWGQSVSPHIYLLGGARPLDPVKESREVLCTPEELPFKNGWTLPEQMPTTEAEMMEFTWQQSQLPSEWKYELVNTSFQPKDRKNPDGEKRPPNTGDTVRHWFMHHQPKPGTYLAVSNQPFVQYQELVCQRALRECGAEGFTVHTCGPESSLKLPLATYLDNLAKQLYEELLATTK